MLIRYADPMDREKSFFGIRNQKRLPVLGWFTGLFPRNRRCTRRGHLFEIRQIIIVFVSFRFAPCLTGLIRFFV